MSDIENKDRPISATHYMQLTNSHGGIDEFYSEDKGLTKREYFAGLAMQGIISSKYYADFCNENAGVDNDCAAAKMAVIHADALLKELENKNN